MPPAAGDDIPRRLNILPHRYALAVAASAELLEQGLAALGRIGVHNVGRQGIQLIL